MSDNDTENSTPSEDRESRVPSTMATATIEDQAPTLVRYYIIAGLVIFFIMTVSVALIMRQFAINRLIQTAEEENGQLIRQFQRESWSPHIGFVRSSSSKSASELRDSSNYERLEQTMSELIDDDQDVLRINLYDGEGFIAFSTLPPEIGQSEGNNELFGGKYPYYWRSNELISERFYASTFDTINGSLSDRQIVISYMLLERGTSGGEQGFIAVFRDVTAEYQKTNRNHLAVIGVAFLIMLVPSIRLLVFSKPR